MANKSEITYTSSTARIVAERNTMQADIMELADATTERMQGMREELRHQYWSLHKSIAKHEFNGFHEQTNALEKLGQLAIAIKRFEDACSAFNTVRCF